MLRAPTRILSGMLGPLTPYPPATHTSLPHIQIQQPEALLTTHSISIPPTRRTHTPPYILIAFPTGCPHGRQAGPGRTVQSALADSELMGPDGPLCGQGTPRELRGAEGRETRQPEDQQGDLHPPHFPETLRSLVELPVSPQPIRRHPHHPCRLPARDFTAMGLAVPLPGPLLHLICPPRVRGRGSILLDKGVSQEQQQKPRVGTSTEPSDGPPLLSHRASRQPPPHRHLRSREPRGTGTG
mmetsp:Transcript_28731/g.56299  ORF Transcript_28731/g.56299 Transcript_28731/m.56299 type:complete len:241 (-) Transcript_28731:940-1662(-)